MKSLFRGKEGKISGGNEEKVSLFGASPDVHRSEGSPDTVKERHFLIFKNESVLFFSKKIESDSSIKQSIDTSF